METFVFKPDLNAIERRKKIKPFGKCEYKEPGQYIIIMKEPPKFIRSDIIADMSEDDEEPANQGGVYVFKPNLFVAKKPNLQASGDLYVPPSLRNIECSVKIINIPVEMKKHDIENLVREISRQMPTRVHLVHDRETRESLGYAYVTFMSEANAKDAIKKIDGFIVDSLILGAEIAKKQSQ